MKKLFYMISAVALMASSASCNKIEQENTPAETPSVEGTTTITVSAAVPQTKTYFRDGKTFWTQDDVVTLLGQNTSSAATASATQETIDFSFTGWPTNVTPEYLVFNGPLAANEEEYTWAKVMSPVFNADGTITAEVREKQQIVHKSNFSKWANLSVGLVTGAGDGIYQTEMKNVCGLIKFKIEGDGIVADDILIENLGDAPMTGVVKVDYNAGNPRVTEVVRGNKSVTITAKISSNDPNDKVIKGTYYACVLPGTYTPKITINLTEGEPIVLTAKSEVTINRNEYVDFGVIDNVTSDEGGDDDPVVPTETLTLTLDFSSTEFTPALPTSAKKTAQTYAFESGGITYEIELGSPKQGYWKTSNNLRLVHSASVEWGENAGYMKLPAVDGFALTGFEITRSHSSGTKNYKVFATSDFSGDDSLVAFGLQPTDGPKEIDLSEKTSAGVGYYLATITNNAQFSKLVLTYTKVN